MSDIIYRYKSKNTGRYVYLNEDQLGQYPDAIIYMTTPDGSKADLGTVRSLGMAYGDYEPDLTTEQRFNRLGIFFNEDTRTWQNGDGRIKISTAPIAERKAAAQAEPTREQRLIAIGYGLNPSTGNFEYKGTPTNITQTAKQEVAEQQPESQAAREIIESELTGVAPYGGKINTTAQSTQADIELDEALNEITGSSSPSPFDNYEVTGEPVQDFSTEKIGQSQEQTVDEMIDSYNRIDYDIPNVSKVKSDTVRAIQSGQPSQSAPYWRDENGVWRNVPPVTSTPSPVRVQEHAPYWTDENGVTRNVPPITSASNELVSFENPLALNKTLTIDDLLNLTNGNYAVLSPDTDGNGTFYEIFSGNENPVVLGQEELANLSSKISPQTPLFTVNDDGTYSILGTLASPNDPQSIFGSTIGTVGVPQSSIVPTVQSKLAAEQQATTKVENLSENQQKMIQTITEIAKKHGLDPNFMNNVAYNESKFDPAVKNAIGATGLFQITGPTWDDLRKNYGTKYNFTASGRTDPIQNATGAALLLLGHKKNYEDNGFPANNTDLYMGNFLGRAGGRKFLNQYYNGDKNKIAATDFVKAAKNNPTLFYKDYEKYGTKYPRTYAEMYALMGGKLNYTF